jgi:GNAT superfamily N-acetyltransferase
VPARDAVELVRFYVDQAWHGQGIAHTLMQKVRDEAARMKKTMWLGVWERNLRAIRFYAKAGFVDVGSHMFQLGRDRQTDRIMWQPAPATSPERPTP